MNIAVHFQKTNLVIYTKTFQQQSINCLITISVVQHTYSCVIFLLSSTIGDGYTTDVFCNQTQGCQRKCKGF